MSSEIMRKYIDILNEAMDPVGKEDDDVDNDGDSDSTDKYLKARRTAISKNMAEAWDTETQVSPSEQGKYKGKTVEELRRSYNALKATGPHPKGSAEYGRMRELAFAIRAKTGWGGV
jgi:hypothetical protein